MVKVYKQDLYPTGGISNDVPIVVDRTKTVGELRELSISLGLLPSLSQSIMINRINYYYNDHPPA